MAIIRIIILLLLPVLAIAQGNKPFGGTNANDTAYTAAGAIRAVKYANSDPTKVLTTDDRGFFILIPLSGTSLDTTDKWVNTIFKSGDSLYYSKNGAIQFIGTVGTSGALTWNDTNVLETVYGVDTAKSNIRSWANSGFIHNGTSVQAANFNITGSGRVKSFVVSTSDSVYVRDTVGATAIGFTDDTSTAQISAGSVVANAYGIAITGGKIIASGNVSKAGGWAEDSSDVVATGNESLAFGFAQNKGRVIASGDLSAAIGYAGKRENGLESKIEASGYNSIASGVAWGSTVIASGQISTVRAWGSNDSATASEAVASGGASFVNVALLHGGSAKASGNGSAIFGTAQRRGYLLASGPGSFVTGIIPSNGSDSQNIRATNYGSVAHGVTQNGGNIFSDGYGSMAGGFSVLGGMIQAGISSGNRFGNFAWGHSVGGVIGSYGQSAFAFGSAYNDSLWAGDTLSVTFGKNVRNYGKYSFTFGNSYQNSRNNQVTFGWNNHIDLRVDGLNHVILTNNDADTLATLADVRAHSGGSGGGVADGDKGDITVSSSGSVWTIDNNAVTNAKINDVAWSKITGAPSFLTAESDPVFSGSDAATIDATDISNWNDAWAFRVESLTDDGNSVVKVNNSDPANPKIEYTPENIQIGMSQVTNLTHLLDGKQPADNDLLEIAGITPANDDIIQHKAGAWTNRSMSQLKTDLALSKSDVGLSNVDNTSDATKNAATATLTNKTIDGDDNTLQDIPFTALKGIEEHMIVAISDETTDLTTGTARVTFRMPYAATITAVRASLSTESSSGDPTFDINEDGISILSTKLTIDVNERTSMTAATSAVISDPNIDDDAEITIDVDVSGTGAKGAKITIYYTR